MKEPKSWECANPNNIHTLFIKDMKHGTMVPENYKFTYGDRKSFIAALACAWLNTFAEKKCDRWGVKTLIDPIMLQRHLNYYDIMNTRNKRYTSFSGMYALIRSAWIYYDFMVYVCDKRIRDKKTSAEDVKEYKATKEMLEICRNAIEVVFVNFNDVSVMCAYAKSRHKNKRNVKHAKTK